MLNFIHCFWLDTEKESETPRNEVRRTASGYCRSEWVDADGLRPEGILSANLARRTMTHIETEKAKLLLGVYYEAYPREDLTKYIVEQPPGDPKQFEKVIRWCMQKQNDLRRS